MMDLLDATIASVAGPVMQADLGGSYADLQWITAAYTLAMASNYNGVGRPAAVLVRNGEAHLVRRRETIDDLLDLET